MAATAVSRPEATRVFQQAIDTTIRENGEVGMQVAVYHDGQLVVDVWGGIADETTSREVDGETLFPSFSVIKATTATALHLQAERGLIEYREAYRRILAGVRCQREGQGHGPGCAEPSVGHSVSARGGDPRADE